MFLGLSSILVWFWVRFRFLTHSLIFFQLLRKFHLHLVSSLVFPLPPAIFLVKTRFQGHRGRPRFGGSARVHGQDGVLVRADVLSGGDNGRRVLGPVRAAPEPARGDDAGGWDGPPIGDGTTRWDGSSGGVTRLGGRLAGVTGSRGGYAATERGASTCGRWEARVLPPVLRGRRSKGSASRVPPSPTTPVISFSDEFPFSPLSFAFSPASFIFPSDF